MNSDQVLNMRPIERNPKVSIIIPTYNGLNLLKACIESIQKNTQESYEVIVVSNGCTDGTREYVQGFRPPFRSLIFIDPLGFPAAVNAGLEVARGEYAVLLNNDTAILGDTWLRMLMDPMTQDPKVGITGPVKFWWDCGGIRRQAIAFWCAMIRRSLFAELGGLDEVFSPGMGEDGDFSIKAEEAGYRLVQVPEDGVSEFGKGIPNQKFPIYHAGSATFGKSDYSEVRRRNEAILESRYGRKDDLEAIYQMCLKHPCDVNELFPTLREYASKCRHLTEFGVRGVVTTWAFLASRPKRLVSYDIEYNPNIEGAKKEASKAGISFEFRKESTLEASIEETDLLFIDTTHTYWHLKTELDRHADQVRKFILIHDTESYGNTGADGGPGEKKAIQEFLLLHPEWFQKEHIEKSNGLTILERKAFACSIIVPTCGKDWENVLKKCVGAVTEYTDLSNKELIVVANGAPQEAIDFLDANDINTIVHPQPIGYIRAVNEGIRKASSSYVVLLDDDSFLMPQPRDLWFKMLLAPFLEDPKMGAAGPFGQTYEDLGQVLHSGCTLYRKSILEEIGLFDEAFNPGYMGDEDVAIRIRKAGYSLVRVPKGHEPVYVDGVFQLQFPVLHAGTVNTMPKHTTDLPLVKRNRDLLLARHGKATGTDPGGYVKWLPVDPGIQKPKISIVIPTAFAKLDELLKPNLQSLIEYTDLTNVEVIVVANGCTDGTEAYVKSLGPPFKVISFPDAMGYTRATNEGLKVATGDYLVLYNNDNVLLPQHKNRWMDQLLEPFKNNPRMGITGPLQLHDDYADADVIIGFCLCISRAVLQDAMAHTNSLLDEVFSPGGGEDIDLCCRVRAKGYVVRQVPKDGIQGKSHQNTGDFQIWHKSNKTFEEIEEYTRFIIKKNGLVNLKRYNKNIRLNIGSGGIEIPGYLSVDLHDRRATIIMDVADLDFDENSVSEILAVHVFEHLNPYKCLDILKSWKKILKPGGRLIMEMPNIEELCRRFVSASTGERYGILNAVHGSVNTTDSGDPTEISSPHLFSWWPQSIADLLYNAGFVGIAFGLEQFPHPESNMHVEAIKP